MSDLIGDSRVLIAIAAICLIEVYEEDLISHRDRVGKGKSILRAF